MEYCALDRCGRQDGALDGREALETGSEKRVDRRGNGQLGEVRRGDPAVGRAPEQRVVDEHRHEFLSEERIALGRAGDPRLGSGRQRRAAKQVGDQLAAFRVAEPLEDDRRRVAFAGPPARTRVEELRPRDADEQDREIA